MNEYNTVIASINFVNSAFLISLGSIIIVAAVLLINNLIMNFYKPMGIVKWMRQNIMTPNDYPKEPVDKVEPK